MGADLYLQSEYRKSMSKYEPLFNEAVRIRDKSNFKFKVSKELAQKNVSKYYDLMLGKGYFRDSYNCTSIFWMYDLSWWQMLGTKRELSIAQTKKLKKLFETKKPKRVTAAWLRENRDSGTAAEWNEFFEKKRNDFIEFLKLSIKRKERIKCSV